MANIPKIIIIIFDIQGKGVRRNQQTNKYKKTAHKNANKTQSSNHHHHHYYFSFRFYIFLCVCIFCVFQYWCCFCLLYFNLLIIIIILIWTEYKKGTQNPIQINGRVFYFVDFGFCCCGCSCCCCWLVAGDSNVFLFLALV